MDVFKQMEKARVMLNKAYESATPEIKEGLKDKMQELNKIIITGTKDFNETVNGNNNDK